MNAIAIIWGAKPKSEMYTRPIRMTSTLTNMNKITTLQALIESSMPAELKKMQLDPQKI